MIVDSCNIEFGNELFAVIPYAYYQFKNKNLDCTVSGYGSEPFYYFSPYHVINDNRRDWNWIKHSKVPNVTVEQFTGEGDWLPPPYKEHYRNNIYNFDKPIFVIANKYSSEWGGEPKNFLSKEFLLDLINDLYDDYKIFYNRLIPGELSDGQTNYDLGEYQWIRRMFPEVSFIKSIPGEFNLTQLQVYANCDRFISVQGGNSILASYFGGRNIIYAIKGKELNGFYNKLHKLSGCDVRHVKSYDDIISNL